MSAGVSAVAGDLRDLTWIKASLQTAIELECSTLPLYLSSMFSLEVQNYTAYNSIRSVVMEEMVHMAIAANMLAALGGRPQVADIAVSYPTTGLPGGVEPDLRIGLAPLSHVQLKRFMRLEMPATLVSEVVADESYPTIAAFYASIAAAVEANADTVRQAVAAGGGANQVGDDIGFTTIDPTSGTDVIDQLLAGVDEIMHQGEGSTATNLFAGAESEAELSHYGKFAELHFGAAYQDPEPPRPIDPTGVGDFFKGRSIPWPVVVNTLAVPTDGYAKVLAADPGGATVQPHLDQFDGAFTNIMTLLDQAWNGPAATSFPTLGAAVKSMVDLRVLSCFKIMRTEIPTDVVAQLADLYPDEHAELATLTDLTRPVYYGPRFRNTNGPR